MTSHDLSCSKVLLICFRSWMSSFPASLTLSFSLVLGPSESERESRSVMSDSLQPHGLFNTWNAPGQNTGVGSHSLLQGIFPTQGSNPGLPHCRHPISSSLHQAPPSMGFSRQEYWSGLPFTSPGDLPDPEIKPVSPALQADFLLSELPGVIRRTS